MGVLHIDAEYNDEGIMTKVLRTELAAGGRFHFFP